MKSDLDHLPAQKQRELTHIKTLLLEEFDKAMHGGSADWRRTGRLQWLILFGSYARGDWVDDFRSTKGYKSDYDLLIVVSHRKIIELTNLWDDIEQRLFRDPNITTPVTFILETHDSINNALARGHYFFSDIRKQGIALHNVPNARLSKPKPQSDEELYEISQEYFEGILPMSKNFFVLANEAMKRDMLKESAFLMHQAVEHAYSALLLTLTHYTPPTHRLKPLRSLAEDLDHSLIEIWPREGRKDLPAFNKLVDAYVKARYSKHYKISAEELLWLGKRAEELHKKVNATCRAHLKALAEKAGITLA